jgi:putative nucleotidyltransferase with HDIG domain
VAHPDRTRVGAQAAEAELVAQLQRSVAALADGGVARVAEFRDTAGRANLGAYAVLPEVGWGVVAAQPRDDAFASVGRMRQTVGLAFGASLLLAVILAAWFARQLTRPVTEFVRGALEIARGRFGHQVNVRGGDEIGELAYTFNFMSRELKSYDDETKRLVRALEAGYLDTIKGLAAAIDAKDPYTRGHSQRVADLSVDIGREMGLEEKTLRALEYGGILHDIGKIGVVESILCKRTRLTEEEMQVMREHPAIGAEIVDGVDFLIEMVPAIRSHHERWDGTGYPDKLRGEEIPIIARIVNAADTWDACTSTRPYSIAMTSEKALEVLTNLRGLQTDPRVHDALVAVVRRRQTSRTVIIQTPVAPPRPAEPAKDDGEGSEKDATAEKLARY